MMPLEFVLIDKKVVEEREAKTVILENRVRVLQDDLQAVRGRALARQKEVDELQAQLKQEPEDVRRLRLEKNAVIERLNEATKDRDVAQKELKNQLVNAAQLRRELDAAKDDIEDLNNDLADQEDDIEDLNNDLADQKDEIYKVEKYLIFDVPDATFIGAEDMTPVEKVLDLATGRRLQAEQRQVDAQKAEAEVKRLKEIADGEIAFVERLFKENRELREQLAIADAALLAALWNV
jgi:chromosome segregation ATPase